MLKLCKTNTTKMISFGYFLTLVTDEEIRNYKQNRGLYWLNNSNYYIAVDNSKGQAVIKEFDSLKKCIDWLI